MRAVSQRHRTGSPCLLSLPSAAYTCALHEHEYPPSSRLRIHATPCLQAYIGFPISFGMAAFDPGFTLTPIFDLTPE